MREEIINRVAQSKLQTLDLEDYYVPGTRSQIDIAPWLLDGMVLVESRFRESVKTTDFTAYQDHHVALHCSTDAIIPQWAWMLVQSELTGVAKTVIHGSLEDLEIHLYNKALENIDLEAYQNVPVIVKGCSNKPVPTSAYISITGKLQQVASSLMFGEACSAVPVYKKPKAR
ncbi:DUF2480 family protein [Nonlabens ponticola]|uniref:DUF2480 family protein n=1 Tax=Nonlabens ponticola TaxID=2496866 RepID=A0A3S9MV51_9FLAO|nr:DUF2480 family protein [Nonlabens ponticola]AZQ43051.1 DUF2480 family protein [Nonlabens ponticola]